MVLAPMQVVLDHVSKSFGQTNALDDVTLEIPPGSIVAVLGLNGAGKSTLLRAMAGVCALDKGVIRYDSEVFHRERLDLRKRLLFTPDIPFLFLGKSVLRNISTFIQVYERDVRGREHEIAALMEDTGIAELALKKADNLSRGQAWKLALACCAAVKPELWLVDEPFASGMDVLGIAAYKRVARSLADAGGIVIYTTQLIEMATEFSDHVCILGNGRLRLWEKSEAVRNMLDRVDGGASELFRSMKEATS